MEKKFNRSLILPIVYFILSWLAELYCAKGFVQICFNGRIREEIGLIMVLSMTPTAMIISSLVSMRLIKKHDIHIGKYIPHYVISVIASVLIVLLSFKPMFQSGMPLVVLLAVVIFWCLVVKDFNTRMVLILNSPIIYYIIFVLSFALGFYLDTR